MLQKGKRPLIAMQKKKKNGAKFEFFSKRRREKKGVGIQKFVRERLGKI